MEKMLNIFVIASVLSMVCGAQYAYFGDNLVEFDDVQSNTISLPYPYQEPHVVKIDQRPVNYGYGVQTAVVESQDFRASPFGFICTLMSNGINFIKKTVMYVITSIPALIFGCFSFLGVCKLTAICKFFNIDPSKYINEITSFVSSDRLKRATEFVETAIKKYRELQDK